MNEDRTPTVDDETTDETDLDDPTVDQGPGERGGDDPSAQGAGPDPAAPAGAQDAEAALLREQLDAVNDRHLRLAAEFENFRRRSETEMAGTWGRAQADLLRRFLDALDDLQRVSGFEEANTTVHALVEGVDLVERKFMQALSDAGVAVISPEEGESFDPASMEAMMRVPSDDEGADDTVHQVFQRGYSFKGTLVRPARVSVYKVD